MSFYPTDIPDCQLWIDSNDYNDLADETLLQTLTNKGLLTVSVNQANIANQPKLKKNILNNFPAIVFSGNQYYNLGNVLNLGTGGLTVFAYGRSFNDANNGEYPFGAVVNKSNFTADNGRYVMSIGRDILRINTNIPNGTNRNTQTQDVIGDRYNSFSCQINRGVGDFIFFNGIEKGKTLYNNTNNYTNSNQFLIGCSNLSTSSTGFLIRNPFIGEIFEILLFNRSLTNEERLSIEQYFAIKYNSSFLLKQSSNYYTPDTKYYKNNKYSPITLNGGLFPNKSDFDTYGFTDLDVLTSFEDKIVLEMEEGEEVGEGKVYRKVISGYDDIIGISNE